jgi:ornithine cyclodeaminase
MIVLDASEVAAALPYGELIKALKLAFAGDVEVPQRTHHDVPVPGGNNGTLLLMPAWQAGRGMGVKVATVFPDNAKHNYPAVFASYFLMSAETGAPIAVLDGTELTVRRTAAASALASQFLSRDNSTRLLMVGTGNLAPHLILAHATARKIKEVVIWGRRREAADKLAGQVSGHAFNVSVAHNLECAVQDADIISCATLASEPLIRGSWLRAGQHLDLVGAFKPDMREADEEAIRRALVYVDTRAGAFTEAGEIVQAIAANAISEADICGELAELCRGTVTGRASADAITLFKSVGTALEDLAAAELAMRNSGTNH